MSETFRSEIVKCLDIRYDLPAQSDEKLPPDHLVPVDVCRELDLRFEVGPAADISGDLQAGDLPALNTPPDADQLGDVTELPGQVGQLGHQL